MESVSFHGGDEVDACNNKEEGEDDEGDETTEVLAASVFFGSILTVLRGGFELSLVFGLVNVRTCVVGSHV